MGVFTFIFSFFLLKKLRRIDYYTLYCFSITVIFKPKKITKEKQIFVALPIFYT